MVTVNLRRIAADLVQMQRGNSPLGMMETSQSPDNSRQTADLISSRRFFRRRLIKSDGDTVVLRIKPDLLDRRVTRDQPGHACPRLAACFGGPPIRHWIFVHGKLFPAIVHIISAIICHSLRISWQPATKPAQKMIDLYQSTPSEIAANYG
jgi:glutamine synthetase adenylyltransferase